MFRKFLYPGASTPIEHQPWSRAAQRNVGELRLSWEESGNRWGYAFFSLPQNGLIASLASDRSIMHLQVKEIEAGAMTEGRVAGTAAGIGIAERIGGATETGTAGGTAGGPGRGPSRADPEAGPGRGARILGRGRTARPSSTSCLQVRAHAMLIGRHFSLTGCHFPP